MNRTPDTTTRGGSLMRRNLGRASACPVWRQIVGLVTGCNKFLCRNGGRVRFCSRLRIRKARHSVDIDLVEAWLGLCLANLVAAQANFAGVTSPGRRRAAKGFVRDHGGGGGCGASVHGWLEGILRQAALAAPSRRRATAIGCGRSKCQVLYVLREPLFFAVFIFGVLPRARCLECLITLFGVLR